MKTYTDAISFSPITVGPNAGNWLSQQTYRFFLEDDKTGPEIIVHKNDMSNGADVPPPWVIFIITLALCAIISLLGLNFKFRTHLWTAFTAALTTGWLLPRVHAEYIEAVFIHDVGLDKHRHLSRAVIDIMFFKAMKVTTSERLNPNMTRGLWKLIRPYVMYIGVSVFGLIQERQQYFSPKKPLLKA